MRAEAWRLVVGYAQIFAFLLSCCFFITLADIEVATNATFSRNLAK